MNTEQTSENIFTYEADRLKYILKWALFAFSEGPIPQNVEELTEWISVHLQILPGSNLLRKMG